MTKATLLLLYYKFEISNSTFANGEVKEFKEVREVKARCFIAKYTTKKAIDYNFFNYYNFSTGETSVSNS